MMRWKLALVALAVAQCGVASASIIKFSATDGSDLYGQLSYDDFQTKNIVSAYGDDGPYEQGYYDGNLSFERNGEAFNDDVLIIATDTESSTAPDTIYALAPGHDVEVDLLLTVAPGTLKDTLLPYGAGGVRGSGEVYSQNEFYPEDNFTVAVTTVPEAATWAMMIGGFGMIGGAMRRKRSVNVSKVSFA